MDVIRSVITTAPEIFFANALGTDEPGAQLRRARRSDDGGCRHHPVRRTHAPVLGVAVSHAAGNVPLTILGPVIVTPASAA